MTKQQIRKNFSQPKYWKQIFCILIIKCILLFAMWDIFFRDAPQLDDKSTGEHVFLKH